MASDESRKVEGQDAAGRLSSRRYEIRRVLGKGGMGTVYEAFDSKDRTLVALKTIDSREAEHLYRLKHEFRALADIQHENIVRFGELSHEDGQWFFSMELVRGRNLLDYVRPHAGAASAPSEHANATTTILQHLLPDSGIVRRAAAASAAPGDARFDEVRLRSTLAQLVSALATIHEAGHVHRDVKPFNILVTDEGRVVLLDFGLVAALAETGTKEDLDWVAGTPPFMAPEQVSGEAGGPEADWYAVGVMLYLALTGFFPFDGSAADIFKAKRELEAPAPRERVAHVPADLDALCIDLLRRAPSERPSADAIRTRLGIAGPLGGALPPGYPVFVGRSADLDVLAAAYADVRAGRGRRVFVEGEPGVGKSALVHHFLGEAGGAPVVLAGRCYEQEAVPFKGLDSVVDALSEHLLTCGTTELGALLAGGVRYLATVFPVLARVPAVAGAVFEGRGVENETGLREQAFHEFERLIDALAARNPLVFYIDDIQWADADSLALLQRILLRANGAACLFVATLRTGMDTPGLGELLASGTRLAIRGLDEGESRALWDALRPLAPTPEAAALRDAAVQEAAGHPLFLAELARAARAGHGGERHIRLQDVLWRRVQERDALERRFLEMLALAGAPTAGETIAHAADLNAGECVTRLGSLKAAQLVRVTRRGEERLVEPYHDRIREAVVERLAGTRDIAERHLKLGHALRDSATDAALPQRVFAILHHLEAARALIVAREDVLEVAALHLAASRAARLATAYDRARDHAVAGLALTGEPGWRDAYALTCALSIGRMEAEYLAGDRDGARRSFESARTRLGSLEDKTALYTAWLALESTHMRFAEALVVGREILRELGAPLPARVSIAHVVAEYAANRAARGRRSIDDLAGLPPLRDAARASAMKILIALGPAAYVSDTNLLTWIMLRIAGISMRHGVSEVSSYGFAGYGMVLSAVFGKHTEGVAFGRLALALNDRFGNAALAGKVHFINASYLVVWTVPLPEAREALKRACAEALRSGDQPYEIYGVLHMTILTFFEGSSLPVLQATAERGQDLSARRREADIADDSNSAIALYAAALRDSTPRALDLGLADPSVTALRAPLAEKTILTRFFYNYCRADVAYLRGEADVAHELLTEAVRIGARAIFGTIMIVELAWLEALVAARRFDTASITARPALLWTVGTRVAKLRPLARSNPRSFDAHWLLALGELLRISGSPGRARIAIERGIEAARAQGSLKREAIGLGLAASYARTAGERARANELGRRADETYLRWGAIALVNRRGA